MTEEQAEYGEREFKNLLEVSEWLDLQGWKLSRSTLYKHAKDGRLRPDQRGLYPQKAIEKYAIQWLKKKTDVEHVKLEKLAEEERKERIGYQSALRKKMEMQLAVLDGKFIPREQMDFELVARAGVLDAGIKALVQLRAEEWIRAAGGSHQKIAEFTRLVLADFDDLVNGFSTTKQFQVMFKEEGTEGQRDKGTEQKEDEE